jgi:hypothetical protein
MASSTAISTARSANPAAFRPPEGQMQTRLLPRPQPTVQHVAIQRVTKAVASTDRPIRPCRQAANLVRAYVPASGHVVNPGGLVANGTPHGGFNGDGHYADQTELDQPQAVTVTRGALLVVADTRNARVPPTRAQPAGRTSRAKSETAAILIPTCERGITR